MKPILPDLTDPAQLVDLELPELRQLCEEIRDAIITTVSRNGGHLGSSLGVVELTVALHTVFDSPRDKLVWDVGHQAYGHKLLTGRQERFASLRRQGGISGFPKRSESEHDSFGVGHASTAISAALGFAVARDATRDDHSVIAILGDGALTGGLAYEGLNNAGQLQTDVIVVLNDNKMSISPNVGAIAKYLTRITSGKHYTRLEADVWDLLGKIPYGSKAQILAGRIKESLKHLIVPTILFEELGFKYFGPIDGHDLNTLIRTFRSVRKIKGPVLVHTITQKGKGYLFAEQDEPKYHGVGKFDKAEGVKLVPAAVPSYTSVFGDYLVELAAADERVHAITAAMPEGTGIDKFRDRFPDRFHDVGIAEQHAVTFAAGLAAEGLRPVVAIYSTFLQRAFDQIIHDVALQNLPVVFAIDRGGVVGEDGPTHHGVFDLSFLRMIPNLTVLAPKDEDELRSMLLAAHEFDSGPVAVRYPRGAGLGVPLSDPVRPLIIGQAEVLSKGEDVCLLALGAMVRPAEDAAALLARKGFSSTVVNLRSLKPLDSDLLASLWPQHRLLVTLEENSLIGGLGAAILEWSTEIQTLRSPQVINIGIPDHFLEHASRQQLLTSLGLRGDQIAERVLAELDNLDHKRRTKTAS
ncbi:MAG: 1-deoxy-D-xylulose-5-phosphate synthase [bacterium]